MLLKPGTGNREPGTGNGGTGVWEQAVSSIPHGRRENSPEEKRTTQIAKYRKSQLIRFKGSLGS